MSCYGVTTAWIILAVAALSSAQAPANKTNPTQDTWERSRECAAQSEKVVSEYDREGQPKGFPKTVWQNHYSPKYNRCFLQIFSFPANNPAARMTTLQDAFERSTLAVWDVANSHCEIDADKVQCAKVFEFIADHMKN